MSTCGRLPDGCRDADFNDAGEPTYAELAAENEGYEIEADELRSDLADARAQIAAWEIEGAKHDITAGYLADLLAVVVELDHPRPGENSVAMVRRVAREFAWYRQTSERHNGIRAAMRIRAGV